MYKIKENPKGFIVLRKIYKWGFWKDEFEWRPFITEDFKSDCFPKYFKTYGLAEMACLEKVSRVIYMNSKDHENGAR